MSEAEDARDAALHFEGVKVSSRQTKEGYFVTFAIHPSDVPVDLMMAAAGARYTVALVEMDSENRPVKGRDQEAAERAVASAGMLCRLEKFQHWLVKKGYAFEASEQEATIALRDYCQVESRAELRTNREARRLFETLKRRFEDESV